MSTPGRPNGESPRAQRDGLPVNAPEVDAPRAGSLRSDLRLIADWMSRPNSMPSEPIPHTRSPKTMIASPTAAPLFFLPPPERAMLGPTKRNMM